MRERKLGTRGRKPASEPPTEPTQEQLLPTVRERCGTVGRGPATGPRRHTIAKPRLQTAT